MLLADFFGHDMLARFGYVDSSESRRSGPTGTGREPRMVGYGTLTGIEGDRRRRAKDEQDYCCKRLILDSCLLARVLPAPLCSARSTIDTPSAKMGHSIAIFSASRRGFH